MYAFLYSEHTFSTARPLLRVQSKIACIQKPASLWHEARLLYYTSTRRACFFYVWILMSRRICFSRKGIASITSHWQEWINAAVVNKHTALPPNGEKNGDFCLFFFELFEYFLEEHFTYSNCPIDDETKTKETIYSV